MKHTRSSQHLTSTIPARLRSLARRVALLLAIVLVVVLGRDANAGTVFMKNGYIIQGPITDQDEDKIVLGWNNGKVFIYRRFTDSVFLDAGEKEAIARKKQDAASSGANDFLDTEPLLDEVSEELPDDLQNIIDQFAPIDPVPDSRFPDLPDRSIMADGGEEPEVAIVEIIVPDRFNSAELGFSLEAPEGWKHDEYEEGVKWTGPAQRDGFLPSLVVVRGSVDDWNSDDAAVAFREESKAGFAEFKVVEEGNVLLGSRSATSIVGRGTVPRGGGTDPGHGHVVTVVVNHLLVPGDNEFWLVSTFTTEETGEDVRTRLSTTLASLLFGATAPDDETWNLTEPPFDTGDGFEPVGDLGVRTGERPLHRGEPGLDPDDQSTLNNGADDDISESDGVDTEKAPAYESAPAENVVPGDVFEEPATSGSSDAAGTAPFSVEDGEASGASDAESVDSDDTRVLFGESFPVESPDL